MPVPEWWVAEVRRLVGRKGMLTQKALALIVKAKHPSYITRLVDNTRLVDKDPSKRIAPRR